MPDSALLLLSLAGACLVAVFLGHRQGNEARDVRLLAGIAAALGGIALVVLGLHSPA